MTATIQPLEARTLFDGVPSPWVGQDIGAVGRAGSSGQSASAIVVTGGGADIWNSQDAFHYDYQPLVGNGSIIAQVSGQTNTNSWAKAGVMIRETINDDSRFVLLALTPGNGVTFEDRTVTHNTPVYTTESGKSSVWLELVRNGGTIDGFTSSNGFNWTAFGAASIPMVNNVEVGLAVTAHDNSALSSATFSNITVKATGTAASTWSDGASAPMLRWESQSFTYQNKLYVFGGYTDRLLDATAECDVYNPATNTWSFLTNMPAQITHAGVAVVGNTVYLAGGNIGPMTVYSKAVETGAVITYNLSTNTWGSIKSMPAPAAAGGLVAIGKSLYYYGGIAPGAAQDLSASYKFNLLTPAAGWSAIASMPNARNHVGYAAVNGIAYAIGGQHLYNETSGNVAEVDMYNPATNKWTAAASLPMPWSSAHTTTLVVNNKIVILGGQTNGGYDGIYLNNIEEYNPAANHWSAVGTLPEANEGESDAYINGELIVVGGTVDNLGGWAEDQTWLDSQYVF